MFTILIHQDNANENEIISHSDTVAKTEKETRRKERSETKNIVTHAGKDVDRRYLGCLEPDLRDTAHLCLPSPALGLQGHITK